MHRGLHRRTPKPLASSLALRCHRFVFTLSSLFLVQWDIAHCFKWGEIDLSKSVKDEVRIA